MIPPSIGRVVWYYPRGKEQVEAKEQPHSAQIAYVHSVGLINIGYLDSSGNAKNATSVRLIQEGDLYPEGGFCCWMPYQLGQAAKTEAAISGGGKF